MAVSNQTIIQKMLTELNHAKDNMENLQALRQHIASIKLLCELILDEPQESTFSTTGGISDQEMKVMLGDQKKENPNSGMDQDKNVQPSLIEEKSDSIFDF